MKLKLLQKKCVIFRLKGKGLLLLVASGVLIALVFTACATVRKKTVEIEPEISPLVERAGITGKITPVDSSGAEILQEDREKIVINCVLVKEGSQIKERSITENPASDGSFSIDLKSGEYFLEVFLEGFYVKSFRVFVEENRRIDLGEILLERIEPGSGVPLKVDEIEEILMNEGDVSIQPPSH